MSKDSLKSKEELWFTGKVLLIGLPVPSIIIFLIFTSSDSRKLKDSASRKDSVEKRWCKFITDENGKDYQLCGIGRSKWIIHDGMSYFETRKYCRFVKYYKRDKNLFDYVFGSLFQTRPHKYSKWQCR